MKKLIPALCMLLIAAAMLGTSTYAWFSMNTQVTATGMQVVAKSDDTFLLISNTNSTASAIQAENSGAGFTTTTLTVSDEQAKVYPSAPATTSAEVALLTTAGKKVDGEAITVAGVQVTDKDTANAVTNWYTAKAENANASDKKSGTERQLTTFDNYVIKKTVYLTVARGANPANNLKVTATLTQKTGGSDITAAKIIVATSDGGFATLKNGAATNVDIAGSNTNLTDSTVLTVDIYIYYDGNESVVYTNNAANLKGVDISLAFDVDAVPAA